MAVEPWLRGTLTEVEPVKRAVLHALELAVEDVGRWCEGLGEAEMFARPLGLPSAAFQVRHMVRSLDRLLTYAEGRGLSLVQIEALGSEMDGGVKAEVLEEFRVGFKQAMERVKAFAAGSYGEVRGVGRVGLPSTVVGLLVHCAEHTQRHVGQLVTTAKVVKTMNSDAWSLGSRNADSLRE